MEPKITDNNGIGSASNDQKGDLAAKGGPGAGLGNADDNHRISKPYTSDTQTRIAAKSRKTKNKKP